MRHRLWRRAHRRLLRLGRAPHHRGAAPGRRAAAILATPYDTYAAARLGPASRRRCGTFMRAEGEPARSSASTRPSEDARQCHGLASRDCYCCRSWTMTASTAASCPAGTCSNLHRKQLDSGGRQQNASRRWIGLAEAEVLEIIDHHRIGNLETTGPVYFRNVPVGCIATIVYQMFGEQGMTSSKRSRVCCCRPFCPDTLMFRSPTSTPQDEAGCQGAGRAGGRGHPTYAEQMFEAGADLTGRDAEDVFCSDFKVFSRGDAKFGVGQSHLHDGQIPCRRRGAGRAVPARG